MVNIDELIENILIVTNNNLEKIAIDDDPFKLNIIRRKDISFIRTFIETYLNFKKDKKVFFDLLNNNYDNEKVTNLGAKLNDTQSKLINMAKENYHLINEGILKSLEKYFGPSSEAKDHYPEININNADEAIYSLILFYYEQLLFDKNNIKLLNEALGYDFFEEGLDYLSFKKIMDLIDEEKNAYNINDRKYKARSFYGQLKILLKKYDMVKKVFRFGGKAQLYNLETINSCIKEEYDRKDDCKSINRIDLFEGLCGYDNLENINYLDVENSKEDKALIEISDLNGMFKSLTPKEVSYILYNYLEVYKNASQIVSESDCYAFKDLSPISEIIQRRKR